MAVFTKNFTNFTLFLSIIVLQANLIYSKISDYTATCSATDPQLNDCVVRAASQFMKNMDKGIPEYNIPALNPLVVPIVEVWGTRMGFNVTFTNMNFYGLQDMTFKKARIDPQNFVLEFDIRIPKEVILSSYTIRGNIMMLPIFGEGKANFTLHDVDMTWKLKGVPEVRENVTYMKLMDFHISIIPSSLKIRFDDLFNGNKMIGDVMNTIINDNWREIYKLSRPDIEKLTTKVLFEIVDKVFSNTPYHEIFRDLD